MKYSSLCLILCIFSSNLQAQPLQTDVLIIGGGTGGTAAAIQCARLKVRAILTEPGPWLGGMLTSAGVSAIDGNNQFTSGLWEEFRQCLYKHYNTHQLNTGWVSNTLFEPHAGDSIFRSLCAAEKDLLTVFHGMQLEQVLKKGNRVEGAVFKDQNGKLITIYCRICIDATEYGDVLAMSKTPYDLGMEDPTYAKEKIAPGKNKIIQDMTWVAILKDYGKGSNRTIERPAGYDSTLFFKSCRNKFHSDSSLWTPEKMLLYGKLKNGKYMINWPASGNDFYLDVTEERLSKREAGYAMAKNRTLQFVYFIQKDLGFKNLALADDEFPTSDKLALIPYNRESRRMRGLVRLSINDIEKPFGQSTALYRSGISVGDYPVDHHHFQNTNAPKIRFPKIPAYSIPLGALVPAKTEGLIAAEKNISVSNLANGTTRLRPVVMLTGQAAGVLAAYCIRQNCQPANANIRSVQQILLSAGCYLMPYSDISHSDKDWEAIQKAGAIGLIRGYGKSNGWQNKMFFYPDSLVIYDELARNINQFIPCLPVYDTVIRRPVTIKEGWEMITQLLHTMKIKRNIPDKWPSVIANEQRGVWKRFISTEYPGDDGPVSRRQLAILINHLANNPFEMEIGWDGKVK